MLSLRTRTATLAQRRNFRDGKPLWTTEYLLGGLEKISFDELDFCWVQGRQLWYQDSESYVRERVVFTDGSPEETSMDRWRMSPTEFPDSEGEKWSRQLLAENRFVGHQLKVHKLYFVWSRSFDSARIRSVTCGQIHAQFTNPRDEISSENVMD